MVVDCFVGENFAENEGGGGRFDNNEFVHIENSTFSGNRADYLGGGVSAQDSENFEMGHSVIRQNYAENGFGGVEVSDLRQRVHMWDLLVHDNCSPFETGGLGFRVEADTADILLERSTFINNSICGLKLRTCDSQPRDGQALSITNWREYSHFTSVVTIKDVYFENSGWNDPGDINSGGAMLLYQVSNVTLTNATFVNNYGFSGGGLRVDGGYGMFRSNIGLSNLNFTENRAVYGGAISISGFVNMSLDHAHIERDSADWGSGVYVLATNVTVTWDDLHGVDTKGTKFGDLLMWDNGEDYDYALPQTPQCGAAAQAEGKHVWGCSCEGCIVYSTGVTSTALMQNGTMLPPGTQVQGASREVISPPPVFLALDDYGNVFPPLDDMTTGLIAGTLLEYLVWDAASATHVLGGNATVDGTLVQYTAQGAEFTSLQVAAIPGSLIVVSFQAMETLWDTVELHVALDACSEGQIYLEIDKRCVSCSPGYIKFDNSTTECTECPTGLTCLGKDRYVLEDGYYMAPQSDTLCGRQDAECVLRRVVHCDDREEACASGVEEARENTPGSTEIPLETLCMSGYKSSVVLCSSCEEGHYYTYRGSCEECESVASLVARLVLSSILLAAGVVALARWVHANSLKDDGATRLHFYFKAAKNASVGADCVTIAVNHIQMMSQVRIVFNSDQIPAGMRLFFNTFAIFSISVLEILGLPCLWYRLFGTSPIDDHRNIINLVLHCVLPVLIAAPMPYLYFTGRIAQFRKDMRSISQKDLQGGPREPSNLKRKSIVDSFQSQHEKSIPFWVTVYLPLAFFLLIFIHPLVTTHLFQMFNCREYYFLGAHRVAWLEMDRSVQCFTSAWWVSAGMSIVVIIGYVVGFPMGLGLLLLRLRRCKRVRSKQTGECHLVDKSRLILTQGCTWQMVPPKGEPEPVELMIIEPADASGVAGSGAGLGEPGSGAGFGEPGFEETESTTARRSEIPGSGASEGCKKKATSMKGVETALDEPMAHLLVGSLVLPFQRRYYYWTILDMLRRLLQTSVVRASPPSAVSMIAEPLSLPPSLLQTPAPLLAPAQAGGGGVPNLRGLHSAHMPS
ncbi:hypothetical protein CYMTET_34308 [Cymbomonas tetramitiformis]|uniref:Right handed beta helix domain-containing protein n=1 Tax=Cymbomonas tetramitiformis TaxID=36881 RepID=A0AAE0FBG8_9CHLO|nr:hypothetical protein CYMTET_34308 [Cymbomonas tetramitiformis]